MKNVQLSFGEYFWRSTLKTAFPILYKQVENDETKTWHEKTLSASRYAAKIYSTAFLTRVTVILTLNF